MLGRASVTRSVADSVIEFNQGERKFAPRREETSMKCMAAVLLLVAAMSAQNVTSTNKGDDNTGIEGLPKGVIVGPPLKAQPPRHLDIPAISREANGSIVSIVMSDKDGHPIAQGSGFVISKDGQVVTNYHVIKNGRSAVIKFPDGTFSAADGVLESDKDRDVAIIQAHGNGFRALTLGDSDQLKVGEEVVAIGNPLSLESTVSNGIVSAIRTVEDEGRKLVQITAPISPGSSGGPLFNMAGKVVGITTSHMKGGENLNFAIPINDLKWMIELCNSRWGAIVFPLPDEPEPVTVPAQAQANTLHVTSSKYVDVNEVPDNCLSGTRSSICPTGIYTVEGRIGANHFVLQCKSLLLIEGKEHHELKCWRLTPGKDYIVARDDRYGNLLIVDGPDEPVMSLPQQFWSYDVLEETE